MNNCILAIETSCDETSVAVVVKGKEILANVISSQVPIHRKYGGVVPEIASRKHLELINIVIQEALTEADIGFQDISAVAVSYGPGLVGALLVGVSAAKAIAYALDVPLLGVNHMEGHIYANLLAHPEIEPPFLCLVVSGGHTELVYMKEHGHYEIMGSTRDDAAGEAFDKVARAMGLGYPGGPLIDNLASSGNSQAITLPRAYLEENSFDFSFSGLKSSVLNFLNKTQQKGEPVNQADLAASFQQAVIDVLVDKTMAAANNKNCSTILVAGGVAANSGLRNALDSRGQQEGRQIYYPPLILCTDNAAMIGCVAYYKYKKEDFAPLSLNAVPNLDLNIKGF